MNKNSNAYIIIYSTVMVVAVAAVLAFASLSLQDKQNENVRIEKMGDILRSIGEGADADKAVRIASDSLGPDASTEAIVKKALAR